MEDERLAALRRRIWLTYKTRILTERRLRNEGTAFHLATLWVALHLILYSIFNTSLKAYIPLFESIVVCLSIIVFSLSIGNYAFRFFERAQQARECYLRLQRLYDGSHEYEKLASRYHDILGEYPNHASCDYDSLIVETVFLSGRPVLSSDGSNITPSKTTIVLFFLRRFVFVSLVLAVSLAPLAPYGFALAQNI